MKIVVFEVEDWERETLQKLGRDHELILVTGPIEDPVPAKYTDADIISIFIYSNLNAGIGEQFKQLKLVVTRSTGYEHIDLEYLKQRQITICNVPEYGNDTVAEHVFALLLSISHNIPKAVERTIRGDFSLQGLEGFDLKGKVIGVVGTGKIGAHVIEIAGGFNMNAIAFDVHPDEQLASRLKFRYVSMDDLLSQSDIITLHVPGGLKTHHLISKKEFAAMKPGAVLINTSRGDVVDVQALLEALVQKKVAAAGLDVLPEEPKIREEAELLRSIFAEQHDLSTLLADQMLIHLPQVIVTPHSAFNTREAKQRLLNTSVNNIIAFIEGKPQNQVS